MSSSGDLALLALGATVFYLKRCLLDQEIVPIGTFVHYDPNDMDPRFMALDGQTLTNLEVGGADIVVLVLTYFPIRSFKTVKAAPRDLFSNLSTTACHLSAAVAFVNGLFVL